MDESILVGEKIWLVIYWPLNEFTIFLITSTIISEIKLQKQSSVIKDS